jgi:membrane protease YdiL (CAAX protease family)
MVAPARVLTFLEALIFSVLVALFIWRWQAAHPLSWILFPVWLTASFLLHHDTPKTLGWRADNLWAATRQGLLLFGVFIAAVCAAGVMLGALHRLPEHLIDRRRFLGYFAFCLLQQVSVNSYLMNRFLSAVERPVVAAALSSVIFALLHWPNPVLIPVTLIGGFGMCLLFARERNILPLTLGQAILGGLVWWAFPIAWHHSMRVGPGYYSFAHRLVTW